MVNFVHDFSQILQVAAGDDPKRNESYYVGAECGFSQADLVSRYLADDCKLGGLPSWPVIEAVAGFLVQRFSDVPGTRTFQAARYWVAAELGIGAERVKRALAYLVSAKALVPVGDAYRPVEKNAAGEPRSPATDYRWGSGIRSVFADSRRALARALVAEKTNQSVRAKDQPEQNQPEQNQPDIPPLRGYIAPPVLGVRAMPVKGHAKAERPDVSKMPPVNGRCPLPEGHRLRSVWFAYWAQPGRGPRSVEVGGSQKGAADGQGRHIRASDTDRAKRVAEEV